MPLFLSNCMIVIMTIILLVKLQSIWNILRFFSVGCRGKNKKPNQTKRQKAPTTTTTRNQTKPNNPQNKVGEKKGGKEEGRKEGLNIILTN